MTHGVYDPSQRPRGPSGGGGYCRECGEAIRWAQLPSEKWVPLTALLAHDVEQGTLAARTVGRVWVSHLQTCARRLEAAQARRRKHKKRGIKRDEDQS